MKLQSIKHAVTQFIKDEQGLTTVEYAVAGGLVAAVLLTAFTNLGTAVKAKINLIILALGGTQAP